MELILCVGFAAVGTGFLILYVLFKDLALHITTVLNSVRDVGDKCNEIEQQIDAGVGVLLKATLNQ